MIEAVKQSIVLLQISKVRLCFRCLCLHIADIRKLMYPAGTTIFLFCSTDLFVFLMYSSTFLIQFDIWVDKTRPTNFAICLLLLSIFWLFMFSVTNYSCSLTVSWQSNFCFIVLAIGHALQMLCEVLKCWMWSNLKSGWRNLSPKFCNRHATFVISWPFIFSVTNYSWLLVML